MFGQVGQDLAVDLDIGLLELIDEPGVGEAMFAGSGVDLDGPELAEFALFLFAVGELEAPGMQGRFLGLAVFGFAGPQKALRVLEKFLAALCCFWSTFYSCHIILAGRTLAYRLSGSQPTASLKAPLARHHMLDMTPRNARFCLAFVWASCVNYFLVEN